MMSSEMWKKAERREFDAPATERTRGRRITTIDVKRLYRLYDQGLSRDLIAERLNITRGTVAWRLERRRHGAS